MKTQTKCFLILLSIITIQSCSEGVKRTSTDTKITRSPLFYEYLTYTKIGFGAFSIIYPDTWEVIENPNKYACVAILEPLNGDNFRSNFNVVISTQTKNIEDAFTDETIRKIKTYYPDYELLLKEFITLNGNKCMKIKSECTMEGYHVIQEQYVLKNGTTSYTVSFTIASKNYIKESGAIEKIINSLNIR